MSALLALSLVEGLLALALQAPINTQCPVRPTQKAKPANVVVYKGRIIGLC